MEKLPDLTIGARVTARGQAWAVTAVEHGQACALLHLTGLDDRNMGGRVRLLAPFDELRPVRPPRLRRERRRTALATAAATLAGSRLPGHLWTATTARMDLHAWQLEPALAMLSGATRVLLADSVGLGKTVQAGLIAAELAARGLVERMLVVVPASLTTQWSEELARRFDFAPAVVDLPALTTLAQDLPPDVNPWDLVTCAVVSIDFVKRPEVRAGLEAAAFDLLIVDEAHHAAAGTDRGAVVSALAARTPFVVLATATPHDGDDASYDHLLGLGRAGDGDVTIFRRDRARTGVAVVRRDHWLRVAPSPAERRLRSAIAGYRRHVLGDHVPAARLVGAILARRAASSPAAVARTIARRRALVAAMETRDDVQPALPWDEPDRRDDVEADDLLGIGGIAGRAADLRALDRLHALARAAVDGSRKPRRLVRLLARCGEPAVVFSEFRDTIEDLAGRLRGQAIAVVHGGLSPGERRAAVAAFTAGRARVLLATDAAGEGLNLQHASRLVVHVDQPWSPTRLEQRAGRVDRLGQRRPVHVVHLLQPASIEDEVERRLAERRGRIRSASVPDAPCPPAYAEAARIEAGRRLLCAAAMPEMPLRAGRIPLHSSGRPSHLVALLSLTLINDARHIVARTALPIEVVTTRRLLGRRSLRRLRAALEAHPVGAALIDRAIAALGDSVVRHHRQAWAALRSRLDAVAMGLDVPSAPVQVSLFDRRAERAWQLDRRRSASRRDRLDALRLAVDDAGTIQVLPPRLVAVWEPRGERPCSLG